MTRDLPKRRRTRLDREAYGVIGSVCSVTIAVKERARVFGDSQVARAVVQELKDQAVVTGVPIFAYCIMPDHVHLVLGPSPSCDIVAFVGRFKNLAQRAAWRLGVIGAFWQRSFWDHFIRNDEPFDGVVNYVLCNPVRAGIVSHWRQYPFAGSLTLDLSGERLESVGDLAAGDEPPPYE